MRCQRLVAPSVYAFDSGHYNTWLGRSLCWRAGFGLAHKLVSLQQLSAAPDILRSCLVLRCAMFRLWKWRVNRGKTNWI